MGLKKEFTDIFGNSANYMKIVEEHRNHFSQQGSIHVWAWKNKAARNSGKDPVEKVWIEISPYATIKEPFLRRINYAEAADMKRPELYTLLKTSVLNFSQGLVDLKTSEDE